MCGIIAIISKENAANDLLEGLYHLQHRGQDSFGLSLVDSDNKLTIIKKTGLIVNSDIPKFRARLGIGHVRYPTKGAKDSSNCQPFLLKGQYHTISFVHNGQISKSPDLLMYIASNNIHDGASDSYILGMVFLYLLDKHKTLTNSIIYQCLDKLYNIINGAFNCLVLIKNFGLVCFKDPYGIRPLILAKSNDNYMIASETVCADSLDYKVMGDIMNGECLIFTDNTIERSVIKQKPLKPCIFEYIYLARAESVIYGVSVYEARQRMGYYLAQKIKEKFDISSIDYVVPVPDTSKPCAQAMSKALKIPYHEVLIKNRYMSRTFIMNCQENRKKNIKRKFGVVKQYITGKTLLIVDDSIVRGNTIGHIIELLKKCGARGIYVASCSPPVKFNNIHGIDIPDTKNLIANKLTVSEMQRYYNIDGLIYQDLVDLKKSITDLNPKLSHFETQVFNNETT